MKVFDGHVHTCTFNVPVREGVLLFKRQFERFDIEKMIFAAVPCHGFPGTFADTDHLDNLRVIYCKSAFAPNGYAYAGLEYDEIDLSDKKAAGEALRAQAERYRAVGYDGMKMLEGHPNMRKLLAFPLDDELFDPYYNFCEETGYPILMHLANPPDHWDANSVSEYWRGRGCFFGDGTYPSFCELQNEIVRRLDKNPKLCLTLAHFGFLTFDKQLAERYMRYENTRLDVCPGGESYFNILKDPDYWIPFLEKYADRINYGTDTYTFEYWGEKTFRSASGARPSLVRNFFLTKESHTYQKQEYRGIGLAPKLCEKIFYTNMASLLGTPRPIDYAYFLERIDALLATAVPGTLDEYNLRSMKYDFTEQALCESREKNL